MSENNTSSGGAPSASDEYIRSLERSNKISEKAIREAIRGLGLFDGCRVLDMPCGIGNHAAWMVEENRNINVTGSDFAEDHLAYAEKFVSEKGLSESIVFESGDINTIKYNDDSFDFVWCCDGLWPGPVEAGCVAEEPYSILDDMVRITKNNGTIAVVFWSGQKLLPGYPLIEAGLNSTLAANFPVTPGKDPDLHFMRTPVWLKKTGLKNIKSQTFTANIQGPFSEEEKSGVLMLMQMFWGQTQKEVAPELWEQFQSIINPESKDFILNNEEYAGYLCYSMFTGEVVK